MIALDVPDLVVIAARTLDASTAHQEPMKDLRSELSRRLPSARLLEFTSDAPDAVVVSMPDHGSLAAEQLSGREIVTKALELLRENYVFPDLAGHVAVTVEARMAPARSQR